MNKYIKIFASSFVCLILSVSCFAGTYQVGDMIKLAATNAKGVPYHKEAKNSFQGRIGDGSIVEILAFTDDQHWIKVKISETQSGWIIDKYLDRSVDEAPSLEVAQGDVALVWQDLSACRSVVEEGKTMGISGDNEVRVATWNIRWFPDNTNVSWLACTISWMNVDVLAVQEIRATDAALSALNMLIAVLNQNPSENWTYDLHDCGSKKSQHVGFIWNQNKVELSGLEDMWELNPRADANGSPCERGLRPGIHAYVKLKSNSRGFHLITVHTKSGSTKAEREERMDTLDRIDIAAQKILDSDDDLLIIGDFNTMGDKDISASQEIEAFRSKIKTEAPGFTDRGIEPKCTEYYEGHGGWLDHVIVSNKSNGIKVSPLKVSGYCDVLNCSGVLNYKNDMPRAYDELSDHCPVVFEVITLN